MYKTGMLSELTVILCFKPLDESIIWADKGTEVHAALPTCSTAKCPLSTRAADKGFSEAHRNTILHQMCSSQYQEHNPPRANNCPLLQGHLTLAFNRDVNIAVTLTPKVTNNSPVGTL